MAYNRGYEGDDFTPEKNISDEPAEFKSEILRPEVSGSSTTPATPSRGGLTDTTTLTAREELQRSKVDDLYEHLGEELGLPNAKHYDSFEVDGNQLLFEGIEITKKNGELRSVAEIRRRLGINSLQALGFTDYTTPNKGSKTRSQKLLNEIDHVEKKPDEKAPGEIIQMETINTIRRIVHDVGTLTDTSFSGKFTERELKGLDTKLGRGIERMKKERGALQEKVKELNRDIYSQLRQGYAVEDRWG